MTRPKRKKPSGMHCTDCGSQAIPTHWVCPTCREGYSDGLEVALEESHRLQNQVYKLQRAFRGDRVYWNGCLECQTKLGGRLPKGARGITVTKGRCEYCGRDDTLIPNEDFNWPDKKAVFD